MNSKQKVKRGELELVHELKKYGYTDIRRTVQYNGRTNDSATDLVGLPGIHIECKRVEKLNIYTAIERLICDIFSFYGRFRILENKRRIICRKLL